ncbi:MAG: DUF6394 family protein [Propionibacteriaceae bacterium]|jgi:putative Ca2+/H+ antiporter (TMEM165/GDT1 family)|nr:DUF6394 family protein [Propionibacteriaceae bacterium]
MSLEKVFFGFFVVLAAALNFGFFVGDVGDPAMHNSIELYSALVVSVLATVIKLGDRTQIGAIHLATSLVADFQLIASALIYAINTAGGQVLDMHLTAMIVSFSGGALFANLVSVILLVIETATFRRQ